MNVTEPLRHLTRVICHFRQDEEIAERTGARYPLFQVTFDPDPSWYSPCGNYVRFDSQTSEIHGWVHVNDVLVDSILAECVDGEWVLPRNPECVVQLITQAEDVSHG